MNRLTTCVAIGLVACAGVAEAQDWPQWRGPDGRRISHETDLPTAWDADSGVAWRTPLRGLGVSSPIVSGGLVLLTSQVGRGRLRPGGHPALVRGGAESPDNERPLGGERVDGDGDGVVFLISAFDHADGHLVFPHEIVALDLQGERLWERHLARDYGPYEIVWGHSSSPILYEDLVILQSDHETGAYLLALDRRSGETRWRADRGASLRSFSTPLVVARPDGDELVVNANAGLDGYDPSTGEWLWHADGHNEYPVAAATFDDDGMVYTARGHRAGPYLAIRLGGRGVVDDSHVAWRVATGAPYVSSILYYDGLIYMANGNGIVTAVEATTGERVWQDRLGGIYSASPLAGDGKVYLFSETGETLVLRAGREPHVLQRNDLGERVVSSPAVSDGRIFIRTDGALVAVGP
jgi:outer membrane protein assembly factor BamB